jgi:CheY-like chemotaxis protein
MEADVEHSIRAGFDEHLTKPVDLAELERAIARLRPDRSAPIQPQISQA